MAPARSLPTSVAIVTASHAKAACATRQYALAYNGSGLARSECSFPVSGLVQIECSTPVSGLALAKCSTPEKACSPDHRWLARSVRLNAAASKWLAWLFSAQCELAARCGGARQRASRCRGAHWLRRQLAFRLLLDSEAPDGVRLDAAEHTVTCLLTARCGRVGPHAAQCQQGLVGLRDATCGALDMARGAVRNVARGGGSLDGRRLAARRLALLWSVARWPAARRLAHGLQHGARRRTTRYAITTRCYTAV